MNWCFIAVMVLLISCGQSHKGSEKTTTELSDHPVPPGKENIADSLKGQKVNFVLVSFDTKRDNPTRLKLFAHEMGLNTNWILLHGSEETVRTLSVLLHVQYEEDAEGNFSHSNLISVLDKYGVLQYQKEGLEADHSETITTIKKLIQQQ